MSPREGEARPLAYGVNDFAKAASIGRDKVYEAIRSGALEARKVGARTIILGEDGQRWLRSLPALRVGRPADD